MNAPKEEVVLIGPSRSLVGVISEPARDAGLPGVVLSNAGLLHRVGPNRVHVQIARALAGRGIATLRFDLAGLGDSPTSQATEPHEERRLSEAAHAVEFMDARRDGAGVVIAGICSGAELAYELSKRHPSVSGAIMVNGGLVEADLQRELAAGAKARIEARFDRGRMTDRRSWRRFLKGDIHPRRVVRGIRRLIQNQQQAGAGDSGDSHGAPAFLSDGKKFLGVFTEGSASWDLIELCYGAQARGLSDLDGLAIEYIAGCDHVFTPGWAQRRLENIISEWLKTVGVPSP
jgi:pimeloyl-ACP methyl ester carboxylesterase